MLPKITNKANASKTGFQDRRGIFFCIEESIHISINLKSTVPICLLGLFWAVTINNICKKLPSSANTAG